MFQIISGNTDDEVVVAFGAGEQLLVRYLYSNALESVASREDHPRGSGLFTFQVDSLVVAEKLSVTNRGDVSAKHLRFARVDRGNGVTQGTIKAWPRLRVALRQAGLPTLHLPGGFHRVLVYGDEFAVPDYSMSGSSGWIVRKDEVGRYLDALPPLRDSGEIQTVWLESVGWVNTPDECSIRVHREDPSGQEPLTYYDRGWGSRFSSNRQIFRIDYDAGSRLVKRVINLPDREAQGVWFETHPVPRYLEVGKPLPRRLAHY